MRTLTAALLLLASSAAPAAPDRPNGVAARLHDLEVQVRQLRADVNRLKAGKASDASASSDKEPADAAYDAAYKLWTQKRYDQAETALKAVVRRYPQNRRASYAQNLLGRAYLDEGKPGLAAEAFYRSYKRFPRGERAPDSLYFLGQALTRLGKPSDACKAYRQVAVANGSQVPERLQAQLAAARRKTGCLG
ncbi:MAG: tetratricopeptide repeat protein [Sphingomonadaceae bacterium]|nr:tetratricopeptide repeat protein [Sphingomonadaceae bacterium]